MAQKTTHRPNTAKTDIMLTLLCIFTYSNIFV